VIRQIILRGLKRNIGGFGLLSRRFYPLGIVKKNTWGATLALDPYEKIDSAILRTDTFDHAVTTSLVEHLTPGDTLWDIGANFGLHSLSVSAKIRGVTCHCFEPYYLNFKKLVYNAALNRDAKIEKYNFGLSDHEGIFDIYSTKGNLGRTAFSPLDGTQTANVKVITTTGDVLIRTHQFKIPSAIKIDTEGHELSVLKGCVLALQSPALKVIVFESFDGGEEVHRFLTKFGFSARPIGDGSNFVALR
jgi:FkbM family methyltransferase